MALPRPGITQPGFGPGDPKPGRGADGLLRTNRENQGSWYGYLNALRRTPYQQGEGVHSPGSSGPGRAPTTPPRQLGATSSKSPTGSRTAATYGAGQEIPAGQNTANYAAGLRRYGASGRSAPNVGPVRNKAGYNERDRKNARVNGANLAAGDEMSRVRLLGG